MSASDERTATRDEPQNHTPETLYTRELFDAGMISTKTGSDNIQASRSLLQKHVDAWNYFRPTADSELTLNDPQEPDKETIRARNAESDDFDASGPLDMPDFAQLLANRSTGIPFDPNMFNLAHAHGQGPIAIPFGPGTANVTFDPSGNATIVPNSTPDRGSEPTSNPANGPGLEGTRLLDLVRNRANEATSADTAAIDAEHDSDDGEDMDDEYNFDDEDFADPRDKVTERFSGNISIRWFRDGPNIAFSQVKPKYPDLPQEWHVDAPDGVRMDAVEIYPEQDLLLIMTKKTSQSPSQIRLLSLKSGTTHPLAAKPVITLDHSPTGYFGISPAVNNDMIAILVHDEFWSDSQELWVYNWKSGDLHMNAFHLIEPHCTTGAQTAQWLNDHLLMLAVVESINPQGGRAALYICDTKTRNPGRVPFHDLPRVATFRLPEPAEGSVYDQLYAVGPDHYPAVASASTPFTLDPAARIFAFRFQVYPARPNGSLRREEEDSDTEAQSDDDDRSDHHLFVHAGTLERLCSSEPKKEEFAWEEWAPHARIMRNPADESHWLLGPVSHRRILVPESQPGDVDHQGPAIHMLYDFPAPDVLRQTAAEPEEKRGKWQYVLESGVIDSPRRFAAPVISGLPYRKLDTGFIAKLFGGGDRCELTEDYLYTQKKDEPWRVLSFL